MNNCQPSTLPFLTEEIAINALRSFFRDKPFVVFGTGMSCALDSQFGMPALENELARSVVPDSKASEQRQWRKVLESLDKGNDLETALDDVTDSSLLKKITHATGGFVSAIDRTYALKIANGEATWPALGCFRRLFDTLPEGDRILHVLTPNYDTLFEHACDTVGIPYTSGFFGGLERRTDWRSVSRSMLVGQLSPQKGRLKPIYKTRKHVRLYKVHGSLNFFYHRNQVVENNSWMWDAPCFSNRVIITSGLSKYQTLQNYRIELLQSADAAIGKANHFLFLGYGFNDGHLEAYITRKLTSQACKGLIVTKDSNSRIESLLAKAEKLWLVCRMKSADGTRIFNRQYAGWLSLPTKRLWDIHVFTSEILGG